jgi:orotate phosphoribosyltransferase
MDKYQHDFIELAIRHDVLCFGEFTLKSGRVSPYFFNAGKFNSGQALSALGRCYADAIVKSGIAFDVIFGPAYKGIPLACAVTIALAEQYQRDVPYCFNRKEQKDHGEGGLLVGASLAGKRVLVVDDVITAGTAIREVMTLLSKQGAAAAGVVIGLDRQERGNGEKSALQEVREQFGVPVISVIALDTIVNYLSQQESGHRIVARIRDYQKRYRSTGV